MFFVPILQTPICAASKSKRTVGVPGDILLPPKHNGNKSSPRLLRVQSQPHLFRRPPLMELTEEHSTSEQTSVALQPVITSICSRRKRKDQDSEPHRRTPRQTTANKWLHEGVSSRVCKTTSNKANENAEKQQSLDHHQQDIAKMNKKERTERRTDEPMMEWASLGSFSSDTQPRSTNTSRPTSQEAE